jgi:hypothetical protein
MANDKVPSSTAFEDARCALALSIKLKTVRQIASGEWNTKKPTDFGSNVAAWTAILREAEETLIQMGYQMKTDQITTAEASALLSEVLLFSVSFLHDRILVRRLRLNGRGGVVCPPAGAAQ